MAKGTREHLVLFFDGSARSSLYLSPVRRLPNGLRGEVVNGGWYFESEGNTTWCVIDGKRTSERTFKQLEEVSVPNSIAGRDYEAVMTWAEKKLLEQKARE